MPDYWMVNHDTGEYIDAPVTADQRPKIQSQDWSFLNHVQAIAFLKQRDEGGASIEGVDMVDGHVYCMGCVPDTANDGEVSAWLFDDSDKTPGKWFCDACGNVILEDQSVKNTTTCWGCGEDFPDSEMIPRPDGEGECCPACVKMLPEFQGEM
jgi:hypothetical protein